jgi:hypothetical protein
MARSALAYVRGSTIRFYEWLEDSAKRALPACPPVWICGDCHLGVLGPIASASGAIGVQIRDLDQAVIGNPVHDLVRLGLSLASAARGSDLLGRQMLEVRRGSDPRRVPDGASISSSEARCSEVALRSCSSRSSASVRTVLSASVKFFGMRSRRSMLGKLATVTAGSRAFSPARSSMTIVV